MESFQYQCGEDGRIPLYRWEPDDKGSLKGIVQLVHGSCEHAGRYEHFARFLTEQGYVVYANDLRGHGRSVKESEDFGYFGESGGWNAMVNELHDVTCLAREEHPGMKLTMLGHSMGSFLARHYATQYGQELDGLVLSGTAHHSRALLRSARMIAKLQIAAKGSKHRSNLLYKMSYATYNKRLEPSRTALDWLTRDEAVVDQFLQDKWCGFVFTAAGFRDMFEGLLVITDPAQTSKTPKHLPILLISGADDPVGNYGQMVQLTYEQYQQAGILMLQVKLYEGMRHEILNEIGKEEVYRDIAAWIQLNSAVRAD